MSASFVDADGRVHCRPLHARMSVRACALRYVKYGEARHDAASVGSGPCRGCEDGRARCAAEGLTPVTTTRRVPVVLTPAQPLERGAR